ncbi:taste receptor type 2 member 116-like [Hyla sarda]|uniref:taste receptor type 2 member 116-like n=1 Tax=Hyla sarda TaxID=327740 RepID=UPI0024C3D414|nr:taste receptor type 2 member 116-like [Hyla sarda]
MSSPNTMAFLAVLLVEAITGLSSSIFTIICCLSVPGYKHYKISTFSRILMAVSASNMSYLFTMSTNFLIEFLWPHLYKIPFVAYMINYLTLYSITSTSWLTCSLCSFYFLKIIPSQPGILTKLKNMTNTINGGILLVAKIVSLGGGFLSIIISNKNLKVNLTESGAEKPEDWIMRRITFNDIIMALNSLPFFIIIVTTVVSASLLKYYNYQMKKNIRNINGNVKDYRTAVLTMTGLLMLYLLIFVTLIIFTLNPMDTTWGSMICLMLLFSFPTVQTALLTYGNPKLKEGLGKMFTFITLTIGSGR